MMRDKLPHPSPKTMTAASPSLTTSLEAQIEGAQQVGKRMNRAKFIGITTSIVLALSGTSAMAVTEAQMAAMKRCVEQESTKSNDTRGGLSAVEFCAAVVAANDY